MNARAAYATTVPAPYASVVGAAIHTLSTTVDLIDDAAGIGRWRYDLQHTGQEDRAELRLSPVALRLLGASAVHSVAGWQQCAVPEDAARIQEAFDAMAAGQADVCCEFSVSLAGQGVRWLRLRAVGQDGQNGQNGVFGMLVDFTEEKYAAMRERFNVALTQYLIGTDTFDEAVNKIIHLVCHDLGWEWGAFWSTVQREGMDDALRCRHVWHAPERDYAEFRAATAGITVEAGQGLVGQVWRDGEAQWIDAGSELVGASRMHGARHCGLQSGYFFPVTYTATDGRLHSAGVLEFFSMAPRQREAQLPGLAESISALIAKTAQRMEQQERVRVLAQTDAMTELFNRAQFHQLLNAACDSAAHDGANLGANLGANASGNPMPIGVLYIDLDQFKPINDAFGHDAGNVVLCEFAARLRALAPPGAIAARLGGDEFVMMAPPGVAGAELEALAAQVLDAARSRFIYLGHELSISASIGVSLFPQHGRNAAELLHAADAAMYLSKRNGRNLCTNFSGQDHDQQHLLAQQLTLLAELQDALAKQEFFLDYQPIYDGREHGLVAVEALIRWRKSDGSIVQPDMFIPIAERSRLIVHIGRWVMEQVCRDLPRMAAAGMGRVQVHINMAAPEFLDSGLPQELLQIVQAAQVDPRLLCLELTEGVVMQRIEKSLPIMRELSRLGFEISLDDFGMGYSSLSLLKTLPIGSIKIDRLFLQGVPHDRNDCAIVRTLLDLGRNMQIRVIAEGVESDAQLGFLRQFGCPQIQGYLLGRPMPLAGLIARHAPAPA